VRDRGDVTGIWPSDQRPVRYGQDDITYACGMAWLDGVCETVEDWGCGPAYAKRFLKDSCYVGIDGSPCEGVDIITDLRDCVGDADGIYMRHVLEHNWEWRQILANAVLSFRKRMVLVIFTPFAGHTHPIEASLAYPVPDISFAKADLMDYVGPYLDHEESLTTGTMYGTEHVFYLARVDPVHPHAGKPEAEAEGTAGGPSSAN